MNSKYMSREVGEKVKIVSMIGGHQFEIGETVTIIAKSGHNYRATNGQRAWYILDMEIEVITEEEKECPTKSPKNVLKRFWNKVTSLWKRFLTK